MIESYSNIVLLYDWGAYLGYAIYYKQYMHVHHKNGDKLNNKENNLQCLCLYCHANVDERHKKNLTTGANKYIYDDFIKKYR